MKDIYIVLSISLIGCIFGYYFADKKVSKAFEKLRLYYRTDNHAMRQQIKDIQRSNDISRAILGIFFLLMGIFIGLLLLM